MSLNDEFIHKLTVAFQSYLEKGARSNEKLKDIHPFIANSLKNKLKNLSELSFYSLSHNEDSKELRINGRYMKKAVDIGVCKNEKVIAAIGFKFVMSNYKQNSNNYFENMLGETANIRCNSIPYFQILVLPKILPYFDNAGYIKKWEVISNENIEKYKILSKDDKNIYFHTPELTLLYILNIEQDEENIKNRSDYKKYYTNKSLKVDNSFNGFENGIVLNNFELFIDKISHFIMYKI